MRDFDLGLVPASVTPPKSSRYAAWFAIATSVLAFGGLVTTATMLMSQPPDSAVADAPQFPRGHFGTSSSEPDVPPVALRKPDAVGSYEPDTSTLARPSRARTPVAPRSANSPVSEEPTGTPDPASAGTTSGPENSSGSNSDLAPPEHDPGSPQPTPPSNPPSAPRPLSALPSLVERTEAYLAHLCAGESRAAFELTAGELRERGYSTFAEQHPVSCEITAVESGRATTAFATLRVTRPDGGTETQRRELSFSATSPPGISSDTLVP